MEKEKLMKEIGVYIFGFVVAFVLHNILFDSALGRDIYSVFQKVVPEYYIWIDFFIVFGIPALVSVFVVKKIIKSNWKAVVVGLITLALLVFWVILEGMQAALR